MEQLRSCSTDAGSRAKVELMEDLDALIQLFLFKDRSIPVFSRIPKVFT